MYIWYICVHVFTHINKQMNHAYIHTNMLLQNLIVTTPILSRSPSRCIPTCVCVEYMNTHIHIYKHTYELRLRKYEYALGQSNRCNIHLLCANLVMYSYICIRGKCVYANTYIHTNICIAQTYIQKCSCTIWSSRRSFSPCQPRNIFIHICIDICMHCIHVIYMYIYIYRHTLTHTHTHIYMYTCIYLYVYIYMCLHVYICIYIHIYIHNPRIRVHLVISK